MDYYHYTHLPTAVYNNLIHFELHINVNWKKKTWEIGGNLFAIFYISTPLKYRVYQKDIVSSIHCKKEIPLILGLKADSESNKI